MGKLGTYSEIVVEGQKIKGEDLEFQIEREDWNVYKLEDGTRLKMKMTALKILRGVDQKGNIYYQATGEPLYTIRCHSVLSAEVPEALLRK